MTTDLFLFLIDFSTKQNQTQALRTNLFLQVREPIQTGRVPITDIFKSPHIAAVKFYVTRLYNAMHQKKMLFLIVQYSW